MRGKELAPRVLLRTGTFPDPRNWNEDFAALSPELVDYLHARGVITIGIDIPLRLAGADGSPVRAVLRTV